VTFATIKDLCSSSSSSSSGAAGEATFPVTAACQALGVSRSGYYAWLNRPTAGESDRDQRRAALAQKVIAAHEEGRGAYGSPRVYQVLKTSGETACENTVARVMREQGLRGRARRGFVPRTTDSAHAQPVAANLLARDFAADRPDRKWAADITCVPTGQGWLYVAGVIDLCSRKLVGWAAADHMETDLVAEALRSAIEQRKPAIGLLHHSDRGSQYASAAYQSLLARHGIAASMSGKGDCWDNAPMESFWATLKGELTDQEHYATRAEARRSIGEYIEEFYNRKRLHSSLGYESPETFEASLN
jgi:putative transposase